MDDMHAFERQVAGEMARRAGPVRPVDDGAIFRAITAATQPHAWRVQPRFSMATLVIAATMAALFGGLLLMSLPARQEPSDDVLVGALSPLASDGSLEPSSHERCGGGAAVDLAPGTSYSFGTGPLVFSVPTAGWTLYRPPFPEPVVPMGSDWVIEKGPCVAHPGGWETASSSITFRRPPDGLYADPNCGVSRADSFGRESRDIAGGLGSEDKRQQRADLAAAVAAIPGVEVIDGPSEIDEDSSEVAGTHVAIIIPDAACTPLWYDWDTAIRGMRWNGPRNRISVWIFDYEGHAGISDERIWIEGETSNAEMDDEIEQIIESVEVCCG